MTVVHRISIKFSCQRSFSTAAYIMGKLTIAIGTNYEAESIHGLQRSGIIHIGNGFWGT